MHQSPKNSTFLTKHCELNPEVIQAVFGWKQTLNFNFREYLAGCEKRIQHKPGMCFPVWRHRALLPCLQVKHAMLEELSCALSGKASPKLQQNLAALSSLFSTVSFLASYSTAANTASNDSPAQGKTQRTNCNSLEGGPPVLFTSMTARALCLVFDFATLSL